MKRYILGFGGFVGLVFTLMFASLFAVSAQTVITEPLLTADGETAGTFTAERTGPDKYFVSLTINDPWCATEASITMPLEPDTSSAAVAPATDQPCYQNFSRSLLLEPGDTVQANATVYDTSVNDGTTDVRFGERTTMTISQFRGASGYFELNLSGAGLNGVFPAWCVDFFKFLRGLVNDGEAYEVEVLPLDSPQASDFFDQTYTNEVLWISSNASNYIAAGYSVDAIQYAVWLVSNNASKADLRARYGPGGTIPRSDLEADLNDADTIIADARSNADSYNATCGGEGPNGIFLNPITEYDADGGPGQELIMPILLPCDHFEEEEAEAIIEIPFPPEEDLACLKFDPAEQSLEANETPTFHLEIRNCDKGEDKAFALDRMFCQMPPGVSIIDGTVDGGFFQNYTIDRAANTITFDSLMSPGAEPGVLPEGQNFDVFFNASINGAAEQSTLSCQVYVNGRADALAFFELTVRYIRELKPGEKPPTLITPDGVNGSGIGN